MTTEIELKNVKNIYETIALEFKATRTYRWTWITDFIDSLPRGSLIYDIGCGSGRNMLYNGYKFIGFDNCNKFIEICREKGLDTVYSEMTRLDAADASADAILCVAALHHLSCEKTRVLALKEMMRVLKPGGRILLSVWSINQPKKTRVVFDNYGDNIVYWKKKHPRYYYIFREEELVELIRGVGLFIERKLYDCGNEVYILFRGQ